MPYSEESYMPTGPGAFYRPQADDTLNLLNQGYLQQRDNLQTTSEEAQKYITQGGKSLADAFANAPKQYAEGQRHGADMTLAQQQMDANDRNANMDKIRMEELQRENAEGGRRSTFMQTNAGLGDNQTREQVGWNAPVAEEGYNRQIRPVNLESAQFGLQHSKEMAPLERGQAQASINASNSGVAVNQANLKRITYETDMGNATAAYREAVASGDPAKVSAVDQQFAGKLSPQDLTSARVSGQQAHQSAMFANDMYQQSTHQAQLNAQHIDETDKKVHALRDLAAAIPSFEGSRSFTPNEQAHAQTIHASLKDLDPAAANRFASGWTPLNPGTTQTDVARQALTDQRAKVEHELQAVELQARGNARQTAQVQSMREVLQQIDSILANGGQHNPDLTLTGGQGQGGAGGAGGGGGGGGGGGMSNAAYAGRGPGGGSFTGGQGQGGMQQTAAPAQIPQGWVNPFNR